MYLYNMILDLMIIQPNFGEATSYHVQKKFIFHKMCFSSCIIRLILVISAVNRTSMTVESQYRFVISLSIHISQACTVSDGEFINN